MTEQDLSASTGTLDTSETGGAAPAIPAVVTDVSVGLPEGRAFRPEEETRDLVNAAYGVTDPAPFDEPEEAAEVVAEVAAVEAEAIAEVRVAEAEQAVEDAQQAIQDWAKTTAFAINASEWWIGLDDLDQEGAFTWSDGTPLDFTAWNDGEPNNAGEEDCANLPAWNGGLWNDLPCDHVLPYICRMP